MFMFVLRADFLADVARSTIDGMTIMNAVATLTIMDHTNTKSIATNTPTGVEEVGDVGVEVRVGPPR